MKFKITTLTLNTYLALNTFYIYSYTHYTNFILSRYYKLIYHTLFTSVDVVTAIMLSLTTFSRLLNSASMLQSYPNLLYVTFLYSSVYGRFILSRTKNNQNDSTCGLYIRLFLILQLNYI